MRKSILAFFSLFLMLLPVGAWAKSNPVGKIVFLDGSVKIVRNEKPMTRLDIGSPIENFDTITTGAKSIVEIQINKETGVAGTIKLAPNSSFYIELSALKKEQVGTIQMLAGNIALKVDKMTGRSGLNVKTEGAVMGVRGTQFKVQISPAGEFLVGTSEGRVEVTNNEGEVKFSEPGNAVEYAVDLGSDQQRFKNVPVSVSTFEAFEKNWIAERITAFKANAPRAIGDFGRRYDQLYAQLKRAMDKLNSDGQGVIDKWKDQDLKGSMSAASELIREKKALIGSLMSVRKVLFIFERIYYRLSEMREYMPTSPVFAKMDRDKAQTEAWMAQYKYLIKLYADRNEGSVPMDAAASDNFGTDGFFD